jgi:hypothetical protein
LIFAIGLLSAASYLLVERPSLVTRGTVGRWCRERTAPLESADAEVFIPAASTPERQPWSA